MKLRTPIVAVVLFSAMACTGSDPAPTVSEQPATMREASLPAADPSTPEPAPPAPMPHVPDPSGFGDACGSDGDCGWDDACVPLRCIAADHGIADVDCEESAPPPGSCLCVAGHCALRPDTPLDDAPACALEQCGLDQSAGRCTAGSMREANRMMRDVGPACACTGDPPTCSLSWVDPIPCDTVDQCWVSPSPPYHPIERPRSKRGKKFRPCRDGEVAPECRAGRCTLVAYSC